MLHKHMSGRMSVAGLVGLLLLVLSMAHDSMAFPLSDAAWSNQEWEAHCESGERKCHHFQGPSMLKLDREKLPVRSIRARVMAETSRIT